jgi:hypothetical protein
MRALQSLTKQQRRDSVAAHLTPRRSTGSNGVYKIKQIRLIPEAPSHSSDSGRLISCTLLPLPAEAKILVVEYIEHLSYIQHVVHQPSRLSTIGTLYRQIDDHEPVECGVIVLFLSIIASVTHIRVQRVSSKSERPLFLLLDEANAQAPFEINAGVSVISRKAR